MTNEETKYSQVKVDHIDDNGVAHIDSYKTTNPDETGVILGHIIKGEVYWKVDDAQFDPLVKAIVADYISWDASDIERKRVRDRDNAGTILGKEVTDFVNNFNCKKEQFVEAVLHAHPTLQQSAMGLFLKVVEGMAEKEYVDGRNQASKDTAVRLLAGYKEQWVQKFMEDHGETEEKARKNVENTAFLPSNLPCI